jgi:hypothetical protein
MVCGMFVAATVCPHPPVLVPELAAGAGAEVAALRAACVESVRRLADEGSSLGPADLQDMQVVVVGVADEDGEWDGTAGGTMRPFGCDVAFGGTDRVLPLSLTIGAYLLDEAAVSFERRRFTAVSSRAAPARCAAIGRAFADAETPVALLVMGDGSAKRTRTSPGYVDERAIGFDDSVVRALEKADADALLTLDPGLAGELWVAGRPAWQVLAGAARTAYDDGASISATVRYDEAPYGVGYVVVEWTVNRSSVSDVSSAMPGR